MSAARRCVECGLAEGERVPGDPDPQVHVYDDVDDRQGRGCHSADADPGTDREGGVVMGNWEGAIDTDEGRAFHRTVGEHRAWSNSGGWCYPTDLCEWCHGQRDDEQVWLPAEGTPEHEALVGRLVARQSHADWCCTKGCVEDRKMHRDVEFSNGLPVLVGEYPCPGTCACEVDGITRAVLAGLREPAQ